MKVAQGFGMGLSISQAPNAETLADLLEPMPPGAGVRRVVHLKHIPGLPDR